jgi:hypothetical protein
LFDPNEWQDQHEHRIYADDTLLVYAIVDAEDYPWACRWKWHINKPHFNRHGQKKYLCRSVGWGKNYRPKLYLHVEIMKRTGITPPTPAHTLVDHLDGDEFNCQRGNLVWATHGENNHNRYGRKTHKALQCQT